jgi:hypothetical protein
LGSRAAREAQLLGASGGAGVSIHHPNGRGDDATDTLQMSPHLSKGQKKKLRKKQKKLESAKNDQQQQTEQASE